MEGAKDEFSWSSPKGLRALMRWTGPCQPLLGCPQPCQWPGTPFQPSWPLPAGWHPSLASTPGLGVPLAGPQPPWSLARWWGGLQLARHWAASPLEPWHHLYLGSSWADFPYCITFFFWPKNTIACLDHDELCHLISWRWALDKLNTGISGRMQKVINY